jgi:hypothetical protein
MTQAEIIALAHAMNARAASVKRLIEARERERKRRLRVRAITGRKGALFKP